MLLAVYGTLKRGHKRSSLLDKQEFVGEDSVFGYELFDAGDYPIIFKPLNSVNSVPVELYEVDDRTVDLLDSVEGINRGMFERQIVTLTSGKTAIMYVASKSLKIVCIYNKFPVIDKWDLDKENGFG